MESLKAADDRTVSHAERLVGIAEIVKGIIERRGRVVDRSEAAVNDFGEARCGVSTVVEVDVAVPARAGVGGILRVPSITGELARGWSAEEVKYVITGRRSPGAVAIRLENKSRLTAGEGIGLKPSPTTCPPKSTFNVSVRVGSVSSVSKASAAVV